MDKTQGGIIGIVTTFIVAVLAPFFSKLMRRREESVSEKISTESAAVKALKTAIETLQTENKRMYDINMSSQIELDRQRKYNSDAQVEIERQRKEISKLSSIVAELEKQLNQKG